MLKLDRLATGESRAEPLGPHLGTGWGHFAASWRSREVGRQELPLVIEQEFGISRLFVSQALDGVELTQNA